MFRRKQVIALAFSLLAPSVLWAQTKLPRENVIDVPAVGDGFCVSNLFQSNMVLQREKPVSLWGWGAPGDDVTIEFAGQQVSAKVDANRDWKVELAAMPASSEPRLMTIQSGDEVLKLENILVGDVWVLGGQSNMEFPLDRVENGQLEIISANYPAIRILTVPAQNGPNLKPGFPRLHEWSSWFSRHFRKGDWDVCSPEIARELSAIGFVFARRVHMATQVPIGIIDASRGGTTVETWTPQNVLEGIETEQVESLLADWSERVADWDAEADLKNRVERFQQRVKRFEQEGRKLPANETEPNDLRPGPIMDQNKPGNCYASMIAPLAGLAIKGAVFHQGYNNCFNGTDGAIMYRQVFPAMIAAWRNAFNDSSLPFGILSLCTEGPVQTLGNYSELMANVGPYIREAQYQTFAELYRAGDKHIGFASSYDLRRRWYHPQLKLPAGERLARWALATQYGYEKQIRWKPAFVLGVTVKDSAIHVEFDEPVAAVDNGGPILGFAIAGKDGKFHPADADHLIVGEDDRGRPRKDQKTLVLSSPMVEAPIHYRYAWGRSPLGNLQAGRQSDIPIGTQRSDDWPLEMLPLGFLGEEDSPPKLDRRQRRLQSEALKQLDRDRKLQQLKAVAEDSAKAN